MMNKNNTINNGKVKPLELLFSVENAKRAKKVGIINRNIISGLIRYIKSTLINSRKFSLLKSIVLPKFLENSKSIKIHPKLNSIN